MRRISWLALLALACAHAPPPPSPAELVAAHARLLDAHHVIDLEAPAGLDVCSARVVPLDSGRCTTETQQGKAAFVDGTVACGQSVTLCGQPLRCDCSNPLPADPCKGRKVNGYGRYSSRPDGSFVLWMVTPPKDGICEALASVTGGGHDDANVGFAVFGEPIPMDPARHCTCDDFE